MLFNSYIFIFVFLPLTFIVFLGLQNAKRFDAAMAWLAIASLAFYGWWSVAHLFPDKPRSYGPPLGWAVIFGALLAICLASMTRVTEFLYFQF
jgi:hypothetical protein